VKLYDDVRRLKDGCFSLNEMRLRTPLHALEGINAGQHRGGLRVGHENPFASAQVIDATNIAEYYYAQNPKETWNLARTSDFPNLTPPFQRFWIEARHPSKIVSETHGTVPWEGQERPLRWGALVQAVRIAKDQYPEPVTSKGLEHVPGGNETFQAAGAVSRTGGWILNMCIITDTANVGLDYVWTLVLGIDHDGLLILPDQNPENPKGRATFYSAPEGHLRTLIGEMFTANPETGKVEFSPQGMSPEATCAAHRQIEGIMSDGKFSLTPEEVATDIIGYVKPLLLAICFLHCKNVTRVANDPPPKLQKKHVSRGRPPLCRYYTLKVEPMERVIRPGRVSEPTGITQSFHIVRGHIKRYTAERPLMGKHVGSFFWAAHVAGSKTRGVVAKDYEVAS
jgi:hypothetical protein